MTTKKTRAKRAPKTEAVAVEPVVQAVPVVDNTPKPHSEMRKPKRMPGTYQDEDQYSKGYVMSAEAFIAAAKKGQFQPYEGDSYYATDHFFDLDANAVVVDRPDWATKVVFFDKGEAV